MDSPGVDHAHVGLLVGLLLGDQADHSRSIEKLSEKQKDNPIRILVKP